MSGWESVLTLFGLLTLAYVIAVWVGFVVWTYRDVQQRTPDPNQRLYAVLLVAIFTLPGWLVYLLVRPSLTLEEVRIETLQEQLFARELATVSSCTRCRRRVAEDFLVCPYCREALRAPCSGCGRAVAVTWAACAYCGEPAQRAPAHVPEARPAAVPARQPVRVAQRPLVPREAR